MLNTAPVAKRTQMPSEGADYTREWVENSKKSLPVRLLFISS